MKSFTQKKQSGLVFLIFIIFLALALISYYFSSISIVEIQLNNQQKTNVALKQAKQALISYAKTNWRVMNNLGVLSKLPCPDYNSSLEEGETDGNCGDVNANAIGFFPWRTLGVSAPKDGSGSCLLYVVSPSYKMSPVLALNPDSYGQLATVDKNGNTLEAGQAADRLVALIISPGVALLAQIRKVDPHFICNNDYNNIAAYLDDNGNTNNAAINTALNNIIDRFVSKYPTSEQGTNPLNDKIVTISYQDIWTKDTETYLDDIKFKQKLNEVTKNLALCFAGYGKNNDKHLPMPASLKIQGNKYRHAYKYKDASNFNQAFAGRLPFKVKKANKIQTQANKKLIFKNSYCNLINTETGDIWLNWIDHFFYAVSKANKPDAPLPIAPCFNNCVSVNGINYAGIVFFSGIKRSDTVPAQQRYSKPFDSALAIDGDDKDEVKNYLENNNAGKFPNNTGNAIFNTANPAISNDIMYCIKSDMTVTAC